MTRKVIELITMLLVGAIFVTEVSGPMFDRWFGVNSATAMLCNLFLGFAMGWTLAGYWPTRIGGEK